MLDSQVHFSAREDATDYVLVRRGCKPWGVDRFEPVHPTSALATVMRAVTGYAERPDFRVLHFLGIYEHPHNLGPAELRQLVLRSFTSANAPELYRWVRPHYGVTTAATAKPQPLAPATPAAKPRHYIVAETVSVSGAPVPGVRLAVTTPDGAVRTLTTDTYGKASVDGIDAGSCRISLPTMDLSRWRADGGAAQLVGTEPGPLHIVQQGESLSSIADKHGCRDWQAVWSDGKNAALKAKRKSPHVLLPGDRVYLPELQVGQIERSTDATHRITIEAQPETLVPVRLRLESRWRKALDGLAYTLSFIHGGELVTRGGSAPTTSSGMIEEMIPATVESILVTFERPRISFKLRVSVLDPLRDGENGPAVETGIRARLRALGYARPGLSTSASLALFQRVELASTAPDGELDRATCEKLQELYGV